MDTQQHGTDIAADVSFHFNAQNIFVPLYEFKGDVENSGVGQYIVTIAAGEGIDIDHAEIDVHHGAAIGEAPITGLEWHVEELAAVAGQARFRVHFTLPTFGAGPSITFISTDVRHGSITIRRKVPSVN